MSAILIILLAILFFRIIPGSNDVIRIKTLVFRILKVTSTRVELVSMKVEGIYLEPKGCCNS